MNNSNNDVCTNTINNENTDVGKAPKLNAYEKLTSV